jgi:hypothetical protein
MNREKQIHDVLEKIARKEIPDGSTVLPAVQQRMSKSQPSGKLAWLRTSTGAIVTAVIAVLVLASVAVAAYFLWLDPGLRAVREAGLGEDLNLSGVQQTPNPEATTSFQPVPATQVGSTQTIGGVTVSLDWVSLNQVHFLIGFSASGLQAGMSFDLPQVEIVGAKSEEFRGMSLVQGEGETISATFISYQWLDVDALGATADMNIDLPLVQEIEGIKQIVGTAHFEVAGVPTNANEPGVRQQDYSIKVNGHEIDLVWAIFTPSRTSARLCYTLPARGEDWQLQGVTGSVMSMTSTQGTGGGGGGGGGMEPGQSVGSQSVSVVSTIGDQCCADVTIPLGIRQVSDMYTLSVEGIGSPAETFAGPWSFNISLPNQGPTLGLAENISPTATVEEPTASGELGATLQWAYADANRIALEIKFSNWDANYGIGGLTIRDDNGQDMNLGYGSSSTAENPDIWTIILQPVQAGMVKEGVIDLHIEMPIFRAPAWDQPITSFHFDLSLPIYTAQVRDMDQVADANGVTIHLTRVSVTPSYTDVYLCYTKPSSKDWMIGPGSTLEVNGESAALDGYGLLYDSEGYVAGKGNPPAYLPTLTPGRCVQVGYPLGNLAQENPVTMTLTIPELEQSLPEVIPDAELQPALAALRAQGIDISIITVSGSGGGGGGYTINSKPEGMSDEEAMRLFYQTLGYYYAGPWTFTFQVP